MWRSCENSPDASQGCGILRWKTGRASNERASAGRLNLTNLYAGFICLCVALTVSLPCTFGQTTEWPDIRTVTPDLIVPPITETQPSPGHRVRRTLNDFDASKIYHTLALPTDWTADGKFPVIVEYAGNGGYKDATGDECSGRPEGCSLGYGISGGQGFVWICLPYLNNKGTDLAITWWGDAPQYDPQPTLKYCRAAVADACDNFGGNRDCVILCGFSSGAIACNYLGLYDDETSQLWRAFVPYSHYDGVRKWPYPASDPESATIRLARLAGRPQFIISERNYATETQRYLMPLNQTHQTFATTGFRNHNDQWILRPGPARDQLRAWLREIVQETKRQ